MRIFTPEVIGSLAHPGIDTRTWVTYGYIPSNEAGTPEDFLVGEEPITVLPSGVAVDVYLPLENQYIEGRWFMPYYGDQFICYLPPKKLMQVIVFYPYGDESVAPLVFPSSLFGGMTLPPEVLLYPEDPCIITEPGKTFRIQTSGGGLVDLNKGVNGAARKEDAIKSDGVTDAAFWQWLALLFSAVNVFATSCKDATVEPVLKTAATALATSLLAITPAPSTLTGKIIEGSSTVKIGE